jgi:hypothetical protein
MLLSKAKLRERLVNCGTVLIIIHKNICWYLVIKPARLTLLAFLAGFVQSSNSYLHVGSQATQSRAIDMYSSDDVPMYVLFW